MAASPSYLLFKKLKKFWSEWIIVHLMIFIYICKVAEYVTLVCTISHGTIFLFLIYKLQGGHLITPLVTTHYFFG